MRPLGNKELQRISEATIQKTAGIGLANARANLNYIEKTIVDLKKELGARPSRPSMVISAGPSLHRKRSLAALKEYGFGGNIVSADGSLRHCLKNGIVPDYVITLDPHPHRIIRWFGDPRLAERPEDDYFRRQDLDPDLNRDELEHNKVLLGLVNKYGKKVKMIISTSVDPEITKRCIDAGMKLYWWNPIYDDYEKKGSITRKIRDITGVPCMVTGGNVGSACWAFAHAVLSSPSIYLVGMDFSYLPGTDVKNTQYYEVLKELLPADPSKGLIEVFNPHLKQTWLTDPAYYWYSRNMLEMVSKADSVTYNCTEGGILFGGKVRFVNLKKALKGMRRKV